VTAEARENQEAAAAQAAGEAAEGRHQADTQAQHQASGSTVVVEAASTPDDTAVTWTSNQTTPHSRRSNAHNHQRPTASNAIATIEPDGRGTGVVPDCSPPDRTAGSPDICTG
jgi:hypothetical protein